MSEVKLPFLSADNLVLAFQAVCSNSDVAKMKCGKTESATIVKNVLGRKECGESLVHLRENCFSLIVDESTDPEWIKHFEIVLRVATQKNIKDLFLTFVRLENAIAESIYECIKKVFDNENIPYKQNILRFAAEGTSVMMGPRHSP